MKPESIAFAVAAACFGGTMIALAPWGGAL